MYEVDITPEGRRSFNRLPGKVHLAALEAIFGPIARSPHQAGKPLLWDFEGLYSARRGDFRIIYEILEAEKIVLIHRATQEGAIPTPTDGDQNASSSSHSYQPS